MATMDVPLLCDGRASPLRRLTIEKRMELPLAAALEEMRRPLTTYLCRLVLRSQVAEELTQTTFLRAIEAKEQLPLEAAGRRAWLFRVATNLAFDELRRHSTRRETLVFDLRDVAESNPGFVAQSTAMVGTPETKAIAREHLAACFACTLTNLPERKAAALLLKEVCGFSVDEAADILDSSSAQVKNWLHEARAYMTQRYDSTCALVGKGGVCHQCVELNAFMQTNTADPFGGGLVSFESRIEIVRQRARQPWQPWHRLLFELLDELK